jgi:hypothetical protein
MKFLGFLLVCGGMLPGVIAFAEEKTDEPGPLPAAMEAPESPLDLPNPGQLWYRNAGDYMASRSTRMTLPTDVNTKIITDGKRFDVSVGKRIPLFWWGEEGRHSGWSAGIDGGMLASLMQYTSQGRLTFATNTFDGYFGMYVGRTWSDGWLAMFRMAHLSAHLVDNSPRFLNPTGYSQFWNEVIVGKTFPAPTELSDWDLHLQANVGLNNTSTPAADQPRAGLGADFGYALNGPDSMAIVASADAIRAGVMNQKLTYAFFLGMGYLKRPNTTHRPFRFGLAYFRGSDYRNQLYFERQNWLTFEIAAEF